MINVHDILTRHNQQLSANEITLRGQIASLQEELIRTKAKMEHNKELLELLKTNAQNEDINPATTDSVIE